MDSLFNVPLEVPQEAALEVRNLTTGIEKDGKFLKILDDISFSIGKGEIVALAGESGCGKSVTALSILKLLPKTITIQKGEIIFNGQNLICLEEKDFCRIRGSDISIIFQEAKQSLNPLLKVGSQIMESLELSRKNREQRKINIKERGKRKEEREKNKELVSDMLVTLGFDDVGKVFDSYPHQLSGGMCQRVMTAIAAITAPRLLLADEPSSSVDYESQEHIFSLLAEINREHNSSILLITHDLSIIQNFCNRFLIMYAGKIVEDGPSDALISPLHPYTKALINSIPSRDKRGFPLENIPGKVPSIEDRFSGCPFAPRCQKAQIICKETFPEAKIFGNRKVHCYFPEAIY